MNQERICLFSALSVLFIFLAACTSAVVSTTSPITQETSSLTPMTSDTPTIEPSPTPTNIPYPASPSFLGSAAPSLPENSYQNVFYPDAENSTYIFEYSDEQTTIRYIYKPRTGSFNDLTIQVDEQQPFRPSNFGGPILVFDGERKSIFDLSSSPSRYTIKSTQLTTEDDSLSITWEAQAADTTIIRYTYQFSIQGKTLVLQVTSDDQGFGGIDLDASGNTPNAQVVYIPYLTTFNLLLYQDHFTSAFFDWTLSNASDILGPFNFELSSSSYGYAQYAEYFPTTAGIYNNANEVLYFTTSDKLVEVLPNIPNPPSPYRSELAKRLLFEIWTVGQFYSSSGGDNLFLEDLKTHGIDELIVIKQNWQYCGPADCNPTNTPAINAYGGDEGLLALSRTASKNGYLFGLYENYIDLYPDSDVWNPDLIALRPDGSLTPAWAVHDVDMIANLIKPSLVIDFSNTYSTELHNRYETTAAYLDAHSSALPGTLVDYDADVPGAGKFITTYLQYSELMDFERTVQGGPIVGEPGNHFLYAGRIDEVLGFTYKPYDSMDVVPPIVDFDLLRIHPLMVVSGMGMYKDFFAKRDFLTEEDYFRYMAYEIAFCHAGFINTPNRFSVNPFFETNNDWLAQAEREWQLVYPIQRQCVEANAEEILYHVNGEMVRAEQAIIQDQPWQVFVSYDSGLQVYVNLHASENWEITLPDTPSWVDVTYIEEGQRQYSVGEPTQSSYVIPPNGWLVYLP